MSVLKVLVVKKGAKQCSRVCMFMIDNNGRDTQSAEDEGRLRRMLAAAPYEITTASNR